MPSRIVFFISSPDVVSRSAARYDVAQQRSARAATLQRRQQTWRRREGRRGEDGRRDPPLRAPLWSSISRLTDRPNRLLTCSYPTPEQEVCCGKYCSKKGSKKTLALLEELATGVDGVIVEKADMSHTEHGCFDECTMGPNVRVDGAGPQTDGGRILNGIRGVEACAELLGVPVPEPAAE